MTNSHTGRLNGGVGLVRNEPQGVRFNQKELQFRRSTVSLGGNNDRIWALSATAVPSLYSLRLVVTTRVGVMAFAKL